MSEYKYTAKEEKFCLEVATGIDDNGRPITYGEAYRRAYNVVKMTQKSVDEKASQMMAKVKIKSRVNTLKEKVVEKAVVDAAYVLNRLHEIDQMDAIDILNDDGSIKPIREWPKIWRQYLSGMDIIEMSAMGDGDAKITTIVKKIKWPDKVKNLELIGKHLSVGAFVERIDHSSKDGSMSPAKTYTPEEYAQAQAKLDKGLANLD